MLNIIWCQLYPFTVTTLNLLLLIKKKIALEKQVLEKLLLTLQRNTTLQVGSEVTLRKILRYTKK